jgi:hypothetical protein
MFLRQGCRRRRKGKRLYKGYVSEKQKGAGLPHTFNTPCLTRQSKGNLVTGTLAPQQLIAAYGVVHSDRLIAGEINGGYNAPAAGGPAY